DGLNKCYEQESGYPLLGFVSKENTAKRKIFDRYSVGIEVRVTNEIPVVSTESNAVRDVAPPWTTTSAPSRTSPTTPTNPHSQFLSPHVFHGRNSLCSVNDYTRRRRPMTLRIGPRLSLPNKSTSAPTTTTDGEWRALRRAFILHVKLLIESGPHPGIPGYGNVPVSGHLWGKRNQGRTSAPIVGHARPPAIILRTRRSWPVAPTHCRRANTADILCHIFGKEGLIIPISVILFIDPNRAIVGKFLSEKKIFQLKSLVIQPNSAGSLLKISLRTSKSIFVKIGLRLSIALVSPASFSSCSTRNVISGCNCRVL
ncbi:hypothetical protein ALC60_13864, partial [Trachymyrmex zeteki]